MTNILITGSAGFIGFNLSKDLLNKVSEFRESFSLEEEEEEDGTGQTEE